MGCFFYNIMKKKTKFIINVFHLLLFNINLFNNYSKCNNLRYDFEQSVNAFLFKINVDETKLV